MLIHNTANLRLVRASRIFIPKSLISCLLLCLLAWNTNTALAANITWVGGTSTNWNTASNWSSGTVPGQDDAVTIGPITGGNYSPSIATLEMGQWNKPTSLLIRNNAQLTVTTAFTIVGSATIQLSSGGSLIHTGTTATTFPQYGSGTLTITNGTFSTNANFIVNNNITIDTGRFTVNGNLTIASGKSFTNNLGHIQVNGNFTMNNSGSVFHAGKDSVVINGIFNSNGNTFYGDTAAIVINGNGTNNITGNFYTNAANIKFNATSLTEIKSGGRFYVNSGTVLFNDSARVGNNGKLYGGSGSVTFTKSLLVSQDGELIGGSGSMNFEGNATFSNTGTMNAGTGTVNFGGNVTINNSGGTINAESSVINISGDITNSGSFNAGTSTVVLNGDSSQSIASDIVFYNLTIETNGTVQAGGNVTVLNGGTIGSNAEISMPDANDQFNVQGNLVDSSGTLAVNTNKPFVTGVVVNSSTEIVVIFNETVTIASSENASNSSWTGRTISSRSRIDTNKLRIQFTPAISQDVEYTLTFQNIQNNRSPVGTMSAGHTKKFTWEAPSAPSTASSGMNFTSVATTSYAVNWTSGNGTRRIVIARSGSAVNFTPSNGTEYAANASFGSGTNLGSGNYVVYQGTGSSVALTNLSAATTYYFAIYEYNGSGATTVYQSISPLTGSQITAYLTPSTQTSGLIVSGSSDTSITLSWVNGNGSNRIVIARASSAVNSLPTNNTTYSASTTFGNGTQLGAGNYVVYSGSGTSVTISGLEDNRKYFFTVLEFNGTNGLEKYLTTASPTLSTNTCIRVDIKIFMEGPFNGSNMNAALIDNIPDTQVYNTAPWNYSGSEAVNGMPNANVVDWVLVEMREATQVGFASDTSVVGRRAGLLLTNGKIVDLDGVSPLLIQTNRSGRMYAVVYHRTHLPVQSNDSLQRGSNKHVYDFTTAGSTAFGSSSPLLQVSTGVYAMYCGRVANNTSDTIGTFDAIEAWNERNLAGYYAADVNLDGLVDAADRSYIWNNNGLSTQIVD